MVRFKFILILLFISTFLNAQVDRSVKPEPGPAPVIELGEYQTFTLKNGLKVIVVKNDKLPRVAFSLLIDRDPILEGDKVGYTSMAGNMLRRGTKTRTKDELDREIDYIGGTLLTSSNSIYASSLKRHQDKLLELMTDVLFNPTFPEEELEKIKKQAKSNLAAQQDSPDAIAQNVRDALVYGKDHPYGEVQKVEHVDNIHVQDLEKYYNDYYKPNISYLAIVGDITTREAKKLAKKYFENWSRVEVPTHQYKTPEAPEGRIIALVDRTASVQTVLNLSYPVQLKPNDPDAIKARVMNQVLGGGSSGRLFKNIREDKGFTYGAYSTLSTDDLIGYFSAGASVRTEVTDSATQEFINEMQRLQNEKITDRELLLAVNTISGSFARSLENPQTIAGFAVNKELYDLPEDYYATYVKKVQNTTAEDVMDVARELIKPESTYVIAVGKASEINEGLKQFGEVRYFDMYGNEAEPPKDTPEVPEGLTAEEVLNSHLQAIGGKEAINNVQDVKMEMTASVGGQELSMTQVQKIPDKSLTQIKMGEMVVNKIVVSGEKASMQQMGQSIPLTPEQIDEMKLSNALFMEEKLKDPAIKTELTGTEKIDGQDAYEVKVTLPGGGSFTNYYAVDSGLKIRTEKALKTPQGEFIQSSDFGDYKEVGGIKFPHKIVQTVGPQKIVAEVKDLKVNTGVEDAYFNIN